MLGKLPNIGVEVSWEELMVLAAHHQQYDILLAMKQNGKPPKTFKSDGCSLWPDEWLLAKGFMIKRVSLYPACFWHDVRYWIGRPGDDLAKLDGDAKLMIDVAKIHSIGLGELMFTGVRAGGIEELELPFSWGFGWRK